MRFFSSNPSQWASIPVFFGAALSVILLGLPLGGAATSVESGWVPIATHVVVPQALTHKNHRRVFVPLHEHTPVLASLSVSPRVERPRTLLSSAESHRVLAPERPLTRFVNATAASGIAKTALGKPADPRLPKLARTSTFSRVFLSQVGSDPWALPGVGFPNVETHSGRIRSNYKPYHAVMDWRQDAGRDEWMPVPAVFCMGLSAQEIAARAAAYERKILDLAVQHGVSASLVKAVITKESCFDKKAVSKAGAEGLMQLMPATARWLKVTDSTDVNQNLSAGVRYLADLRKRFGSEELALAAYNAGPGNVERHGGIPPFQETQQYVKAVMGHYRRYAATTRFTNQRFSSN